MKMIVSPYSRALRSGHPNAKNYPYWVDLVKMLNCSNFETIQIGISGEQQLPTKFHICDPTIKDLTQLLAETDTWISVDNFFQHFANYFKKPGIVLWGKSDPNIFGYPQNLNILKDRALLRPHQFGIWDDEVADANCFLPPEQVFGIITKHFDMMSVVAFDL